MQGGIDAPSPLTPSTPVGCFALALAGIGLPAVAGPGFQLGESTSVDTSLTVGYTSSMRLNDASPAYLADLNNDDGTRNFSATASSTTGSTCWARSRSSMTTWAAC